MASPCGIFLSRNYIFMSGYGAVYGQRTTFFIRVSNFYSRYDNIMSWCLQYNMHGYARICKFGIIKWHVWIWHNNVRICTIKYNITNSSSSLLCQDAWHYDYVKIRMCITMSGYGSIKPEYGISFFQNMAYIVRTWYYVTHHFKI